MNKREKEILQLRLDAEDDVIAELEKQYRVALNDINRKIRLLQSDELTQSKVYQIEYQKALKGQIEGILEKMHGDEYSTIQKYLHDCYEDAFIGTVYDMAGQGIPLIMPIDQAAAVKAIMTDSKVSGGLYNALGVDVKGLKKAIRQEITRGIATGQTYSDIARNISEVSKAPMSRAKTIARTEGHRIQQASTMDAQEKAKAKGADVLKQWDSTMDGETRPTHRRLDGQIREVDEPFEADGKKAMYPGGFGDPAEDCNCRCASLTRARWGLDEAELQTLKDRAEYFGLDKTDGFESFKEKYLNAAKSVENSGKSGIMESKWDNSLPPRGQVAEKINEDDLYSWVANELGIPENEATEYVDAVMTFTDAGSDFYSEIRRYQRGEPLQFLSETEVKKISDDIETYIQKAPRWNGGITFRGSTVSDEELATYKPGYGITMGGTSSWSGKRQIAKDFAERNASPERPNPVIYHCDTQNKGTGIRHISVYELEDEVLCSKESKWEVVRTEMDSDYITHVYVKEV